MSERSFATIAPMTMKALMLWFVFAVLTGAAVLSVLWPLVRAPRGLSRGEIDVAFYKAQLAEIDRDAAEGIVAASDAEGAKAEAARRLLSVSAAAPHAAVTRGGAGFAIVAALVFVPVLSVGLYRLIGHPGLPDLPLSARLNEPPGRMDVAAAIAKIEEHLAQNPDDGRGFEVMAPVYMRMGRYDDAVKAYAAALRLLGDAAERRSLYGEALVAQAKGDVTADARQAFEAATAKDPSLPRPRFYLGLAAQQAGDKAQAIAIWTKLLADGPADAPWASSVRKDLAVLTGVPEQAEAGAAPQQAEESPAPQQAGPAANPGLASKIQSMSAADQAGAIHGMVDRLAARLAENGQDVEGWLRLVRAYSVLNESDKARSALSEAKRNLAGDAAATGRIDALARELGLEG